MHPHDKKEFFPSPQGVWDGSLAPGPRTQHATAAPALRGPARKNYIGRTYERAIFGRAALFLVSAGRGGRVRGCWGERGRSGAGAAPGEDGAAPGAAPSSPAAARPCGASI